MPRTYKALSFGSDALLLNTREMIIEKAGIEVVSVQTLVSLETHIVSGQFDLFLFCHSLSESDCHSAIALISRYAPSATILILSSGSRACSPTDNAVLVDMRKGPAELANLLSSLVFQAKRFTQGDRRVTT